MNPETRADAALRSHAHSPPTNSSGSRQTDTPIAGYQKRCSTFINIIILATAMGMALDDEYFAITFRMRPWSMQIEMRWIGLVAVKKVESMRAECPGWRSI